MKEKKDKKKSKYTAPIIQVDSIATEHWIAAHSDDSREAKKDASRKIDKDEDANDGKS